MLQPGSEVSSGKALCVGGTHFVFRMMWICFFMPPTALCLPAVT